MGVIFFFPATFPWCGGSSPPSSPSADRGVSAWINVKVMVTHGEWHLGNDFPEILPLLVLTGASRALYPFMRKTGTWESSMAMLGQPCSPDSPPWFREGITSLAFCFFICQKSHLALGEVAGAVLETHRRGNKTPSSTLVTVVPWEEEGAAQGATGIALAGALCCWWEGKGSPVHYPDT